MVKASEFPYVVVRCNFSYADEFDCEFVNLMTQAAWQKLKASIHARLTALEADEEVECGFGTNEHLTFTKSDAKYFGTKPVTGYGGSRLEVVPITEAQFQTCLLVLGSASFGTASNTFEELVQSEA